MTESAEQLSNSTQKRILSWLLLLAGVYAILLSVGMVGSGFKWASGGSEGARELFAFATNPFLALLIGILATALVQSSSTVTSVIVGLVAGGLPIEIAIPMVMGANIGTTITNTLVSLGHVRKKSEFRRAFAAATVHDFFNLMCVIIFLPLEIIFGFLEKGSAWLTTYLIGADSMSMKGFNFIKPITKPVIGELKSLLGVFPDKVAAISLIVIGIILIFVSITIIGRVLKGLMVGRAKKILHGAIGRGPISGITSGAIVTVLVQSSSTTTSLMIPLVGSGVFKPRDIYPFTLGANIGTTITALLAATALSGAGAVVGLQIALVHLMYNLLGVVVIYGIPFLRELPLKAAERLAEVATKRHSLAALYVLSVFFLLPGLCVLVMSSLG
ncbi:Na/Pi symporter [Bermanella sp. WJH001]|uniref:Na/Pi symporter n=1 Tax=Bermanella sp. WJH001 TaxID=3048005 RepID=UPI0024BD6208|nr:Na/Pi symporter [Bermanella sp. WJH001]MDJ1536807.1 Na/Pi symporter [Bermanella sp. WJH001]